MIKVICVFLISSFIFAINSPVQSNVLKESMDRGREVYNDFCLSCHLGKGEGTKGIIPPLAKSDYLLKKRAESIHAIKFGQQGKITVNGVEYNGVMTNLRLTDEEIADVMNFILNSWGNQDKKIVTVEEVKAVIK